MTYIDSQQQAKTISLTTPAGASITLRQPAPGSLIVEDGCFSLALSINKNGSPQLQAINDRDLTDHLPVHLLCAALDYVFSHSPCLEKIAISFALSQAFGHRFCHDVNHHNQTSLCFRSGFYQDRTLWHWQPSGHHYPEIWTQNDQGITYPIRQIQPAGTVYQRYDYQADVTVSFRTINAEQDLDLFHQWMNQTRVAEFWEMAHTKEELAEYIHTLLEDKRTWPLIGCFNGKPFGYMECYWAMEDRIAPYYDCQPWDRGFHLLVGNSRYLGARYSRAWTLGITHFLFLDDPRTTRLVGEPRADNNKVMKLLAPASWEFVKEFDFPHKRAALVNGHRQKFFEEVAL